jgi:hypothetical protein
VFGRHRPSSHHPAPQGFRAVYVDGSTSDPLPLLYLGIDEDGQDLWEAMLPDSRLPHAFRVDELPARTSVQVRQHLPNEDPE